MIMRDVYIPLTNISGNRDDFEKEAFCRIPAPSRVVFSLLNSEDDDFECKTQPYNISLGIRTQENSFLVHGLGDRKT